MFIRVFPSGPLDTNAYLIACASTRHAAVIDPSQGSHELIVSLLKENHWVLEKILLTHSHWDHIADVTLLKTLIPVPVYVHTDDKENLMNPGADKIPGWLRFSGVKPDVLFKEGDAITIGKLQLQVIHTPGHSPGSVCFYIPSEKTLISGDTLFKGSIGTLSLPTAEPERMWISLKKLAALPPDTKVYPGHGPSTTIGAEKWLPEAQHFFG